MTRTDDYRRALTDLDDWGPFLLEHSGLPGPRANIELGQAVASMGTQRRFSGSSPGLPTARRRELGRSF
jgi:hypothetical protein